MKTLLLRASLFCALLFAGPAWAVEDMTSLVLQNAVVADGNGNVIAVGGYDTVAVDVAITTTATVNFEGGTLGSAISSVVCTKVGDVDAVPVISTTASGLYQCNVAGLTGFRARVSNWAAGAVTVVALATTASVGGGGGGGGGGTVSTATAVNPSYAEGSTNSLSTDIYGNLRVTLGTLLAGEDQSATGGGSATGVMVTEQRYLLSATVTGDTQIKGSAGFAKDVTCIGTDAVATAGSIVLYDKLTEAAPAIWTWTVAAAAVLTPITFPLDVVAVTGLYLGFTTVADVQCYVRYR